LKKWTSKLHIYNTRIQFSKIRNRIILIVKGENGGERVLGESPATFCNGSVRLPKTAFSRRYIVKLNSYTYIGPIYYIIIVIRAQRVYTACVARNICPRCDGGTRVSYRGTYLWKIILAWAKGLYDGIYLQ